MNLACVFKFSVKPTVLKKAVPVSKKNRMLEQVRIMEQDMAAMEQQLKRLNVRVQIDSPMTNGRNHSISSYGSTSSSSLYNNNNNSNSSVISYDSDTNSSCGEHLFEDFLTTDCECTDPTRCSHILKSKRIKYETDPCSPSPSTSSSTTSTINSMALITTTSNTARAPQNEWRLTVSQTSKGITFQTSIKNIADVAVFLTESLRYFSSSPNRTPNYHADRSQQTLTVTNKMLKVEYVLHSFFQKKKMDHTKAITFAPICDNATRASIKLQLIRHYFNCMGLLNPVFSSPYFLPMFEANPDSMTASAIAAFIAYSQCRHVTHIRPPLTREIMADSFRQEAKELLEDVLFEEEPSIMLAGSLMLLAQCALITLENVEARLYMNMAWRMVVQLKDKYIDTVRNITSDTPVTPDIAIAESWRRMFYAVRYLELNLYMIYDGLADFSSILFDSGIGYPIVLKTERDTKEIADAVFAYSHVVRLHNGQISTRGEELAYQLFAGNLDSINVNDIEKLENQLITFWKNLPQEFRLSDSPLEYLQTDRIQQCANPHAIYLNQLYYAYWLALETRLMRSPATTDLLGANMERFDGDRALLIVSVCCDAISKIFYVLFCRLPCTVELHWLLIAGDAMAMLKKAANPRIKARAQKNLRVTLRVLKDRVQRVSQQESASAHEEYNLWKSMLPENSLDASVSNSTSSGSLAGSDLDSVAHTIMDEEGHIVEDTRPPAAYFGELKKALNTYFPGYEQTSA